MVGRLALNQKMEVRVLLPELEAVGRGASRHGTQTGKAAKLKPW